MKNFKNILKAIKTLDVIMVVVISFFVYVITMDIPEENKKDNMLAFNKTTESLF